MLAVKIYSPIETLRSFRYSHGEHFTATIARQPTRLFRLQPHLLQHGVSFQRSHPCQQRGNRSHDDSPQAAASSDDEIAQSQTCEVGRLHEAKAGSLQQRHLPFSGHPTAQEIGLEIQFSESNPTKEYNLASKGKDLRVRAQPTCVKACKKPNSD